MENASRCSTNSSLPIAFVVDTQVHRPCRTNTSTRYIRGNANANRFETRHQEARRQVRCSLQHAARVHDSTGRRLPSRFVCVLRVINAIQIQRMQIVEGSNELVAPTGGSGLVLARYSMTDSLSLFSSHPFIVSNSIHYHFLPRSDNRVP